MNNDTMIGLKITWKLLLINMLESGLVGLENMRVLIEIIIFFYIKVKSIFKYFLHEYIIEDAPL